MKSSLVPVVTVSLLLSSFTLRADVVRLKDGRTIQGIFLGGSSRQIDLLVSDGKTLSFSLTSISGITFMALPKRPPRQAGVPLVFPQRYPQVARPS